LSTELGAVLSPGRKTWSYQRKAESCFVLSLRQACA